MIKFHKFRPVRGELMAGFQKGRSTPLVEGGNKVPPKNASVQGGRRSPCREFTLSLSIKRFIKVSIKGILKPFLFTGCVSNRIKWRGNRTVALANSPISICRAGHHIFGFLSAGRLRIFEQIHKEISKS
jgi:hypothetical protein